uniref:SARP family regulator n=1 Tax=Verrucosispora sp. TaxID=1871626 RepID=A0A894JQJ7_9ACTN|nr:SARP family regulator [Verrucosispora sp.]
MHFKVLGALEVEAVGSPLPLGGFNQRAVLGLLLLHANNTVAASRLIKGLWGDTPPATARKMLQNYVSRLRSLLAASAQGERAPVLLTSPPGYLLRVPAESVDLIRFERLVERGNAEAHSGGTEAAARTLREALALWRGHALADLVEFGIEWPELSAVQNLRFAAIEAYVDAELSLGRHQAVLDELERAVADALPPRERLCGQLMLALYRSGRQADALTVYRRLRETLADQLGLDPGRALQQLERQILDHDPSLMLPAATEGVQATHPARVAAVPAAGTAIPARQDRGEPPAHPVHQPPPVPVVSPEADQPDTEPIGAPPAPRKEQAPTVSVRTERKRVSVLHIRTRIELPLGTDDPEDMAEVLSNLDGLIRSEVELLGGLVQNFWAVGSAWLALFGVPSTGEDDPELAVRAALAIRDRIATGPSPTRCGPPQVAAQIAIATGDALVTYRPTGGVGDGSPDVQGSMLNTNLRVIDEVPPGAIRVCDVTRQATADVFHYSPQGEPTPRNPAPRAHLSGLAPLVERDREMDILGNLLADTHRRRQPNLMTLLGEAGIGKTRLVAEWLATLRQGVPPARLLTGTSPGPGTEPMAPLRAIARSFAGITETDSRTVAERKLQVAVHGLPQTSGSTAWLLSHLRTLLGWSEPPMPTAIRHSFPAWRLFLEAVAVEQLTVVVLEDLHRADDLLLDFVEELANQTTGVPLSILATARPELLQRRPFWGGGMRNATVITLTPLSATGTWHVLESLALHHGICAGAQQPGPGPVPGPDRGREAAVSAQCRALLRRIGGNPLFATEYFRMHRGEIPAASAGSAPPVSQEYSANKLLELPQSVYNTIAAQLDTLPAVEKAVLQDAAVFGDVVWPRPVAALGNRDAQEVARRLEQLERRDLVDRVHSASVLGQNEYAFRSILIRDVAYSQLPRSVRLDKHHQAARWVEHRLPEHPHLLIHHYWQTISLSRDAGRPIEALTRHARTAFVIAAERTSMKGHQHAASRYYQAALELCPPNDPGRAQLLRRYRDVVHVN